MTNHTISFSSLFASLLIATAVQAHDIGHAHEHVENGWNSKAGFVSDTDHTAYLWNPRGKSQEEINARIQFLAEAYVPSRTPEQEKRAAAAKAKYKNYIAINSVMPAAVAPAMAMGEAHFHKGLKENHEAGITLASASVYNTKAIFGDTLPSTIANTDQSITAFGAKKIDTIADIRQAKKTGTLAVMYNTQGADFVLDGSLKDNLKWSSQVGIRVMNTTYNNDNALAGGGSKGTSGLTKKGKTFVKYANQQGIVLDCSHASNQTCIDTANESKKPIVASHSNVYALYPHTRNLTDDAILAIGQRDGAVCPTGAGGFLSKDGSASPEIFAEHVVYVANLIGKDKVCYSTDAVHNVMDFYQVAVPNTEVYPPELGMAAPIENLHAKHIWDVVAVLEDKYNWSQNDIVGFLGENLMRVYEANWKK
ncbi:dipeptidase [Vibrio astriarenae]|uniref:dipeptidase n=1 Tax=Vibrio astriarenae TaxID=1481923 RepID=UPI0037357546